MFQNQLLEEMLQFVQRSYELSHLVFKFPMLSFPIKPTPKLSFRVLLTLFQRIKGISFLSDNAVSGSSLNLLKIAKPAIFAASK